MSEAKIIEEMPEEINVVEIIKKSIDRILEELPEDKLRRVLAYILRIF